MSKKLFCIQTPPIAQTWYFFFFPFSWKMPHHLFFLFCFFYHLMMLFIGFSKQLLTGGTVSVNGSEKLQ